MADHLQRRDAGAFSHLYTHSRWRSLRRRFLAQHPLCCMCEGQGVVKLADVVDHRIPHRGDMRLFWDVKNLAALCKHHHDSDKQAIEKSGRAPQRIGVDGFPIEPAEEPPPVPPRGPAIA